MVIQAPEDANMAAGPIVFSMGMVKMFNFFLPEFRQNPYPFYQTLQLQD
jgi:hypothetical protein